MSMSYSVDSNMKKITNWSDVNPFAEKIVAYQTDSYYFGHSENNFYLKDSKIWFGYISEGHNYYHEPGHDLEPLLKPTAVPYNHALIASKLGCSILMRVATREEIDSIANAIDTDQAKFNYRSKQMSKKIIETAIKGSIQ